jgi:hypothetical protein
VNGADYSQPRRHESQTAQTVRDYVFVETTPSLKYAPITMNDSSAIALVNELRTLNITLRQIQAALDLLAANSRK